MRLSSAGVCVLLVVVLSSLLAGCLGSEKIVYVCVDGSRVSDPSSCVSTTSTTSTTTSTTSTTTSTTSTTTSTTSTTLAVACKVNSDCGQRVEERVCYKGDVYIRVVTPRCMEHGTPQSYCIQKISWPGNPFIAEPTPLESCSDGCINGTCL